MYEPKLKMTAVGPTASKSAAAVLVCISANAVRNIRERGHGADQPASRTWRRQIHRRPTNASEGLQKEVISQVGIYRSIP